MKEYKIEIEIDEKGNIVAETKGIKGKICADELNKVLKNIEGKKEGKWTKDYYEPQSVKINIKK